MTIKDVSEPVEVNYILSSHSALPANFRLKTCQQVDVVKPRITSFMRAKAIQKAV